MRKKIFSIFALGALLLMASCSLHDDNEIFDTPAAQRMEETIANDKALLESATNGWELHLWMGEEYSAGGYTYFMKFANDKVTVGSDIATPSDWTTNSSYDVISDEGPVLTINTYNEIFHYLANPESDGSQVQQDYEFIITRTTNDSIYLTGKKYGNKMVMTRVADGVSWADEIDKIQAMQDSVMFSYTIYDGTDSVGSVELSNSRVLTAYIGGATETRSYYFTPTGIVMSEPVAVNGKELTEMNFNGDALTLSNRQGVMTPANAEAAPVTWQFAPPEGWMSYDEFEGTWRLYYNSGSYNPTTYRRVVLTPVGDGVNYTMSNVSNYFTINLEYQKASGELVMHAQKLLDLANGDQLYMLGWALDPSTGSGGIYYSTQHGLGLERDNSYDGVKYDFYDLLGYGVNSFYTVETTGVPSSSTWVGATSSYPFWTGYGGLAYPAYMIKQ